MKKDYVREAARAHSNLNTWAAVKALMESSLFYGSHSHKTEAKVAAIAGKEIQKELIRYERAKARCRNV